MRNILLICALICTSVVTAQKPIPDLIREGVDLHDRGYLEEAVSKYDSVLLQNKTHYLALYEKSYTLMELKRYKEAISISQYLLKEHKDSANNFNVYINYGTCLDFQGKQQEAVEIYADGLRKFPNVALLHYNKAVTHAGLKEYDAAVREAQLALTKKPLHASSHNLIAVVTQDNKIYSLLGALVFLAIEPNTSRSKQNLKWVQEVAGSNVKKTGDNSYTISLSPDMLSKKKKKSADDFSDVELIMTFASATFNDEKFKNESEVQRMQRSIEMLVSTLSTSQKKQSGFGWKFYVPFFIDLKESNFLEAFAHIVYMSADDADNNKWLKDNLAKTDAFYKWLDEYNWEKKPF